MKRIQFTAYAVLCCKITITMNHPEVLRNFLVGSFDLWKALPHLSAIFFVPPPSLLFQKDWQDFYVMLSYWGKIPIMVFTLHRYVVKTQNILHLCLEKQIYLRIMPSSLLCPCPLQVLETRGSLINLIDYQVGFSFHYICSAAEDVYLFFLKIFIF